MHCILGDFALQSEFIFLFELRHILGVILCKFEVGFCRLFVSAHGLSDFLFECFDVFVAIGYNRVCFFNFVSFLAVLSVISIILGDILMAMVDPRISFSDKAR